MIKSNKFFWFAILLAMFYFQGNLVTASDKAEPKPLNRLGLAASSFSGVGLSYLRMLGDNFGIKAKAIAWYSEAREGKESDFYASGGLEFQHDIYKTRIARFYPLVGLGFFYTDSRYQYSNYYYDPRQSGSMTYHDDEITRTYTGGIGFGCELLISNLVSFTAEVGYQYSRSFITRNYSYDNSNDQGTYLGIGGGVGVSIAF